MVTDFVIGCGEVGLCGNDFVSTSSFLFWKCFYDFFSSFPFSLLPSLPPFSPFLLSSSPTCYFSSFASSSSSKLADRLVTIHVAGNFRGILISRTSCFIKNYANNFIMVHILFLINSRNFNPSDISGYAVFSVIIILCWLMLHHHCCILNEAVMRKPASLRTHFLVVVFWPC